MKTTEHKDTAISVHSSHPFFSKKGEGGFFGQTKEVEQPFVAPAISQKAAVGGGGNARHTPFFQARSQPVIQPKLTINEPGDKYEQEADAMADRVMRSNETAKPVTGLIGKSLQRKCDHCEEEKMKKPVMRKAEAGNSGMSVSSSFASSLNASKGGGSLLPQGTRNFMENAFSADFSSVKIHTGAQASEMSKSINAKAFTTGNDIYFGDGNFSPETAEGKKLMVHELTHVVQQKEQLNIIQRTCNSKQIKSTTGCSGLGSDLSYYGKQADEIYKFKKGCDDFLPGEAERLRDSLGSVDQSLVIDIHGFASEEGSDKFNDALSCARSYKAGEIIADEIIDGNGFLIGDFINHGEQVGTDPELRSVVLEFLDYSETSKPAPVDDKKSTMPQPPCCIFENDIAYAEVLKDAWLSSIGTPQNKRYTDDGITTKPDWIIVLYGLTRLGYSSGEVFNLYEGAGKFMNANLPDAIKMPADIQAYIAYNKTQLRHCSPGYDPTLCKTGSDKKDSTPQKFECGPDCDRVIVPEVIVPE